MDKPADRPLIPVTLLTGFLGSGKTTVLNLVLRAPKMEGTAVIVNEFGEIGIDDALIEMSSSDAVLLSSGCICCTVKDDLTSTMHDLLRQVETGAIPQFHRVVIETTGIADPGPIMQSLMTDPLITPRYRLAGVVTTVDALHGNRTLDRQHEAVHQAAVADRLLVTKTDIAEKPAVDELLGRLKQLNAGAEVIMVKETNFDPGTLFDLGLMKSESKRLDLIGWLNAESHEAHHHAHGHDHHHGHDHDHSHDHDHHHDHDHECGPDCEHDHHHTHNDHGIQSFCMIREEPVPWAAFSSWMESISTRRGPDLLRVKGIINIKESPDQPLVVHGVQDVFHPPSLLKEWPTADRRTRIVFITRDIEKAALEKTLEAFAKDATLVAN